MSRVPVASYWTKGERQNGRVPVDPWWTERVQLCQKCLLFGAPLWNKQELQRQEGLLAACRLYLLKVTITVMKHVPLYNTIDIQLIFSL